MMRTTCFAAVCVLAVFSSPAGAQTADVHLMESGAVRALYLTDRALAVDPRHYAAFEGRLAALRRLDRHSENRNERGWLAAGIRDAEARLK
jgi:hypothetical protein